MQNELERKIMITVLKEIKQLLEEILAELKKPTAVTIDSEKVANSLNPNDLTDETNILKMENSELREECKFLHKMLIDERRFILETLKYDSIENYRVLVHSNREHEKELQKATQE